MTSQIINPIAINDVVPGANGQRVFPSPTLRHADPFVLLDHIGPQKMPKDFYLDGQMHPHRGFETITFMFAGNLHHKDNQGGDVLLTTGGVQQMNAGSGLSHGGGMWADEANQQFDELQLWVNSPAINKSSDPSVHNFSNDHIPTIYNDELNLRIIAGEQADNSGNLLTGPVKTFANISAYHCISKQVKGSIEIQLNPEHDRVLVYSLNGKVTVQGNRLTNHQSVYFTDTPGEFEITEIEGDFLFLSGLSINEPIVMGGPFVMNSQQEIEQAYKDLAAGYFN